MKKLRAHFFIIINWQVLQIFNKSKRCYFLYKYNYLITENIILISLNSFKPT